jgi:ribosome-associated heat shock protein Hsp15
MTKQATNNSNSSSVRLDKWLWAARFFKTRALARAAVEGGKVEVDHVRAKPGKSMQIGMKLLVRIGFDRREFIVEAISDKRAAAKIAQTLYTETEESIELTQKSTTQRKLAHKVIQHDPIKPGKHQRKKMQNFKRQQ